MFYHLAGRVHDDTFRTRIDRSIQGRIAYYDAGTNTVIASSHDFGNTYWDEKALLVHEATHAILDAVYAGKNMYGKRAPMRVVDAEIEDAVHFAKSNKGWSTYLHGMRYDLAQFSAGRGPYLRAREGAGARDGGEVMGGLGAAPAVPGGTSVR